MKNANKDKRGKESKDAVVKVDAELLKRIELFLEKPENKFKYLSKKQIINLAVIEFLKANNFLIPNSLSKSNKKGAK